MIANEIKVILYQTLKHILYTKNSLYDINRAQYLAINQLTKLQIADYTAKTVDLTIKSYDFEANKYSLIFYTNNPLGPLLDSRSNSFSVARRILLNTPSNSAFQINMLVNLEMDPTVYNSILPGLSFDGSLSVAYNLNNPQFYASYIQANSSSVKFQLFAYVAICLLLLNYAIKYFKTCPKSSHRAELFTHIVAVKACCLILYPTYLEYINFCQGFMLTDFPWANDALADTFTSQRDQISIPFNLMFKNMGILATFLLGLIIYFVFYLTGLAYFSDQAKAQKSNDSEPSQSNESEYFKQEEIKIQKVQKQMGINYAVSEQFLDRQSIMKRNYFEFLYNIFCFGMIFYSCVSFQGALLNSQRSIDMNGLSYIVGILIYIGMAIQTLYSFLRNRMFVNKLRILFKVSLLSLAHINPIYIVSICIVLDSFLIYVQFFVIRKKDDWRVHYTVLNGLCNFNVFIMILLPKVALSLIFVMISTVVCLLLQIYIHFMHYQKIKNGTEFWGENKSVKFNKDETKGFNFFKKANMQDLNTLPQPIDRQIKIQQQNQQSFNNKDSNNETYLINFSSTTINNLESVFSR